MNQDIRISADIVLISNNKDNLKKILFVKRKNDPFKDLWALPGGFVENNEKLEEAAKRELYEETSVKVNELKQFYAFGDPDRDPRGHTVSIAHLGLIDPDTVKPQAGSDAAEVKWFPENDLPHLAFDHPIIVRKALDIIRKANV